MDKSFVSIGIVMAFVFAIMGITPRVMTDGDNAESESEDSGYTYEEPECSYADMLNNYYELNNYDVFIIDEGESMRISVADSYGNNTEYLINDDKLCSTKYTDTFSGGEILNSYEYDSLGNLISIDNNENGEYVFEYDGEDFISGAYNGNTQYINSYGEYGNLIFREYSNGNTLEYIYDDVGRLSELIVDGESLYSFVYENEDINSNDNYTVTKTEQSTDIVTQYRYESGVLTEVVDLYGTLINSYDGSGTIVEKNYDYFSYPHRTEYNDNNVIFDYGSISYTEGLDERITTKAIESDSGASIITNIDYYTYDNRPLYVDNNGHRFDYLYDVNNNLIGITYSDGNYIDYEYDFGNRLISEIINGREYCYFYDESGNMISKTIDGQECIYAEYDNDDKLIKMSDEIIYYDFVGNPLNYNGYELGWGRGRQLISVQKDGTNIKYFYDENGYRTKKIVDEKATYFVYDEAKVIYEKTDDYLIYYIYGLDDELMGFGIEGCDDVGTYYYMKDGLNNIIAIADSSGDFVVTYDYDAYGNILEIQGDKALTIGKINPYRYRGYRYDNETGLYFLNSRYYNPVLGRFINADDISMVQQYAENVNYNLYSYAYANPIKYTDNDGNSAITIGGITIGIGKIIIISATVAIAFFMIFFPNEFAEICSTSYSALVKFFKACQERATSFWEKITKPQKPNSHHIVAKTAKDAKPSRDILENAYIDPVTDMRNRVDLKQRFHQKLHTKKYYDAVNSVFAVYKDKPKDRYTGHYYPDTVKSVANRLFTLKVLLSTINFFQ